MSSPWTYMTVYWVVGCLLGYWFGYVPTTRQPWTKLHSIVLVTTILGQLHLNTRFHRYKRQVSIPLIAVFAVSNGTAESILFLVSYDAIKELVAYIGCGRVLRCIGGFMGFSVYSALIHDTFWLRTVFPRHIKSDAPPFPTHGLPVLMLISAGWFLVYEIHHDVLSVIAYHSILDAMVGYTIAFPSKAKVGASAIGDPKVELIVSTAERAW